MPQQTILIIDDDPVLVETLKEGLESLSYKVVAAYDGIQGVLQAHQSKPDVILLDFQMPAGGGASVYERLRGAADTRHMPIVFLTGASAHMLKETLHSTPHTYFLKKPATLAQISGVILMVLKTAPADAPAPAVRAPSFPAPSFPAPSFPAPAPAPEENIPFARPDPVKKQPKREPLSAAPNDCEVRVAPADAEVSGLARPDAFLRYFELGRAGFMRSIGLPYPELGGNRKLQIPVYETRCEYLAPCRVGDLLRVRTKLVWLGLASICFQHEVYGSGPAEKLVAQCLSRHVVLDGAWKPARLPKDIKALLQPHIREE